MHHYALPSVRTYVGRGFFITHVARRSFTSLSLTEEDLLKVDEAVLLLEKLYGFAPKSRAELVRLAVRDFLAAKRKEFEDRHPLGVKAKRKEG